VSHWKKLIPHAVGALVGIAILAPLGGFLFVKSGIYNVAASSPHTKFTTWLTHETMIHSARRRAQNLAAPSSFSGAEVVAGFCIYETHCVACHGAPGVARQPWVNGLEPQPPYLLDATERFTPQQLFWIVRNGIKMTGMPSWRDDLSEVDTWNLVAWLEGSRKLPPSTYIQWRAERRCGGG
jgi:mono/diheme cytochrome c family protein